MKFNRQISLKDADGHVFKLDIKIEHRDGEDRFSMSSETGQGKFKPANDEQQELLDLWDKWHLNDCKSGTMEQCAFLDKYYAENPHYKKTHENNRVILVSHKQGGTPFMALELEDFKMILDMHESNWEAAKKRKEVVMASIKAIARSKSGRWIKITELDYKYLHAIKAYKFRYDLKKVEDDGLEYYRYFHTTNLNFRKARMEHLEKILDNEIQEARDKFMAVAGRSMLYSSDGHAFGTKHFYWPLPEDMVKRLEELCDELDEQWEDLSTEVLDPNEMTGDEIVELGESMDLDEDEITYKLIFRFMCKNYLGFAPDYDEIEYDPEYNTQEVGGYDIVFGTMDTITEENATDYIKNSLWAFNAGFLSNQTGIPRTAFESMQKAYEDANDGIEAIIDRTSDMASFVEAAIDADGIGHFLNGYDGTAHEYKFINTLYIMTRQ